MVSAALPDERRPDVAVIILTKDEEANIAQALRSVCGWASQVFVFDSFSTDRTLDIAANFDCQVAQHPFENYGRQRNAALAKLPIQSEWVLFLDADEWLPPSLKTEISSILITGPAENGFYLKFRFIWMGRWIRRGYYPTWILRLFRRSKGRCEDRTVNEHLVVDGMCGKLQHEFIHEDRKSLSRWIAKHNAYATREAEELFRSRVDVQITAQFLGGQAERKRWLRLRVWNRLPAVVRPFGYFFYRYVVLGGFLDGKEALIFHLLQAFWFPLLIDAKLLEMRHVRDLRPHSSVGTHAD